MATTSLIELLNDAKFIDPLLDMVMPYNDQLSALQIINQLPSMLEGFDQVRAKIAVLEDEESRREILHWYAILIYIRVVEGRAGREPT